MSKKGWLLLALYAVIIVGVLGFVFRKNIFPEKHIHYHAGFVVFENNKKLDFSGIKYMHTKPCGNGEHENLTPEEEQIEKAHLHDYVGDVVHVHRENATWQDLFTNLKIAIDYTKTAGYLNGKKLDNFQTQTIQPYDSLVVFMGKNDQKYLKEAVTKDHIVQTEKKSDNCGS